MQCDNIEYIISCTKTTKIQSDAKVTHYFESKNQCVSFVPPCIYRYCIRTYNMYIYSVRTYNLGMI